MNIQQQVSSVMPGANERDRALVARTIESKARDGWELSGLRMNVHGEVFSSFRRPSTGASKVTYKGLPVDVDFVAFFTSY